MKTALLSLALAAGLPAFAQTNQAPAEDFKPSSLNQPGKQYPQVNSERQVRARVVAPQAQNVALDIGAVKYPLAKDDNGVWTGVSNPQDEGFHYYQLIIDGAQVPDPGSLYFYGASRWGSGVEIPAADQDFYALKNVPHGQLRQTLYFSTNANAVLRCFIYTPPDYETNPSARYPVLYLQHGGGEDETGWGNQGKAGLILDNLIAEGKAKSFIIVMANSYVPGGMGPAGGRAAGGTNAPAGATGPGGRRFDFSAFTRVLLEDLIPFIDAKFRTLADQPNRAMAGLSMGGMQTRAISLANPNKFSHIGIFSGGSFGPADISDMASFKQQVKVVFFSFGGRERGAASAKASAEALKQAGVNSWYYESPLTGHEWQSWRRSLYQFAPLLFQDHPVQMAAAALAATPGPAATAQSSGVIRIKAGLATPFTDSNGHVWQAEQGFEGGATIERDASTTVAGTKDPGLFLSEHYSMDSFATKVPNGKYVAKLYFSELFEGVTAPGERVFSFNVQGREFKDFDVWVKAGGPNRAYIETVPVEITNAEFRITFTPKVENPQINAIELIPESQK